VRAESDACARNCCRQNAPAVADEEGPACTVDSQAGISCDVAGAGQGLCHSSDEASHGCHDEQEVARVSLPTLERSPPLLHTADVGCCYLRKCSASVGAWARLGANCCCTGTLAARASLLLQAPLAAEDCGCCCDAGGCKEDLCAGGDGQEDQGGLCCSSM